MVKRVGRATKALMVGFLVFCIFTILKMIIVIINYQESSLVTSLYKLEKSIKITKLIGKSYKNESESE
ncbi:MAG: hypothetical protein BRC33_13505 [Cyanobacteria bacterium SW_9_44_58]|nr:MAG: hypothetical protein BRC33_13505 [Cyanobacteria bacterium SW_9_44_58]